MKIKLLLVILMFCTANLFAGDTLTLNNHKVFEGKIVKIKDRTVTFKSQNVKFEIPANQIHSLQFEDVDTRIYRRYLKLEDNDPSNCLKGGSDADMLHGKNGKHFALGLIFGPFAVLGTALSYPTPEDGKETIARSKNQELFSDVEYLSCYKKKVKIKLVTNAAIGWVVSTLLYILVIITK